MSSICCQKKLKIECSKCGENAESIFIDGLIEIRDMVEDTHNYSDNDIVYQIEKLIKKVENV